MSTRALRLTVRLRVLVGLALVAWLPGHAAAELSAEVEPRVVDELDLARLTIRATGSNQTQRLDLAALEEDFEVLTTQSASQYRSINGRVESWVEYQIMLRPRRAGDLTIPPIHVGPESTPALNLRVRGIDPELRAAIDRMVFFETELTANPVYVQAQTVLVRRLYYSSGAQIYSDLPGLPEIAGAIVMPLGEATSTTSIRDGQRYGVIEQRFALFPEQSGALTIPAISVTSSVRLESGGRTPRAGVRRRTEPMTLEVLPIPPEYPADQPWLPAKAVTISDRWTPVDPRVEVGDPITRTLVARVEGNVSSAIPPLEPALPEPHFRRYPEPPRLIDDPGGPTLRGRREQDYAIIPTAPGTVSLPATEVVWWDVAARQVRTARSPGRTMWITGAPATAEQAAGAGAGEQTAAAPELPPVDVDVRSEQVPWPGPARRRALWLTLLGLLPAGAAAAWWLRRRPGESAAARHGLPSLRACRRALRSACRSDDPAAMHDALVRYLRAHYQTSATHAARRFRQDGHGAVLDDLNAGRYRRGVGVPVSGADVLAAVRDLRRGSRPRHDDPLPALYD